jgi:MOSC domain-containing protein YiiM
VPSARIGAGGVEGDRQRDLRFHGGPARAVCLFALERIEDLAAEGHPITPGSTGENLTLEGLEWGLVVPGRELRVGPEVRLAVTSYTVPCFKIAASFADGAYRRLSQKLHPGWSRVYARVLAPGVVRVGDEVVLVEGCLEPLD